MLHLDVGLRESIRKFATDASGATAIEYGLIAALVGVVIIGALTLLGPEIGNMFNSITDELNG